jgi:hypothetical protein
MISTDNEASAKACVLMYYGVTDVSVANQFRQQAATYIDLILRGAKPAICPFRSRQIHAHHQPQDRQALGLTISREMMLIADELLE